MKPVWWKRRLQSYIDRKATILLRDRNRCVYCGFQGGSDGENLTVDHIIPISKGGSMTAPSNMAASCLDCNRIKADKLMPQHLTLSVKTKNQNGRRPMDEYRRVYEALIAIKESVVL